MKKKLLIGVISICILFPLDSCTHYYYSPNQHNVPLFKEKNEARLSGAYFQGNEIAGMDVQAGYAMTKESAIIGNAFIAGTNGIRTGIPNPSGGGLGQLYELGAGYYRPLPSPFSIISKKFVFETYGVLGLGNVSNYYNGNPNYNLSANLFKAYVQPSIGFTSNLFDLIVSAKIGTLYTFGIKRNMPDSTYENLQSNGSSVANDLGVLYQSRTSFIFEPAFTVRVGFKYVKLHFQVSTTVVGGNFSQLAPIGLPVIDAGITIFIAHRFWQKDDRPKKERWMEMFD